LFLGLLAEWNDVLELLWLVVVGLGNKWWVGGTRSKLEKNSPRAKWDLWFGRYFRMKCSIPHNSSLFQINVLVYKKSTIYVMNVEVHVDLAVAVGVGGNSDQIC
jgi:hypothetical protein